MTTSSLTRPFTAHSFDAIVAEHKLMGVRCSGCGTLYLPPRAVCPGCYSEAMEWVDVSGKGKLVGFTVIYVAPSIMVAQGFGREKPYVAGIVELAEGPKVSARITGFDPARPESIQIGAHLTVDFIEYGDGDTKKVSLAFKAV